MLLSEPFLCSVYIDAYFVDDTESKLMSMNNLILRSTLIGNLASGLARGHCQRLYAVSVSYRGPPSGGFWNSRREEWCGCPAIAARLTGVWGRRFSVCALKI